MKRNSVSITLFVTLLLGAGCADPVAQEPALEAFALPESSLLQRNYLGAPSGQTLPFAETFGYGGPAPSFDDTSAEENYHREARAFGSAYFVAEAEARSIVRDAISSSAAQDKLAEFINHPERFIDSAMGNQVAALPHFVREQAAAFAYLVMTEDGHFDRDPTGLEWAVSTLLDNRNATVIHIAPALEELSSTWSEDRLKAARSILVGNHARVRDTGASYAATSPTFQTPVMQQHLVQVESALADLN
jgi:hypothetical protein